MGFSCEEEGNTVYPMSDKEGMSTKVYYDGGADYTTIAFLVNGGVLFCLKLKIQLT